LQVRTKFGPYISSPFAYLQIQHPEYLLILIVLSSYLYDFAI